MTTHSGKWNIESRSGHTHQYYDAFMEGTAGFEGLLVPIVGILP